MSRATLVPITPSVLVWAMGESGYTLESLAHDLKIPSGTLRGWLDEREQPSLTEFRKLVSLLKRTPSTFLLPNPPDQSGFSIQFRRPTQAGRSLLLKNERHAIREARRLQETVSWITKQLDDQRAELPQHTISSDVEAVARSIRHQLTSNLNGSFGVAVAGYQGCLGRLEGCNRKSRDPRFPISSRKIRRRWFLTLG